VAFAVAKYWGLLPHVLWHYPFRYYKELRDAYIASLQPGSPVKDEDENSIDFDINAEIFKGDSL
jgi:hypothetical protein